MRKLRIYDFQDARARLLHERLCWDLGRDVTPGGYQYAVEHEADTDLTARDFLERSRYETDAELLGGVTAARYQVVEIEDGPPFSTKQQKVGAMSRILTHHPHRNAPLTRRNVG